MSAITRTRSFIPFLHLARLEKSTASVNVPELRKSTSPPMNYVN